MYLALDFRLRVAVKINSDPVRITDQGQVVPVSCGNLGLAGDDFLGALALREKQTLRRGVRCLDANVLTRASRDEGEQMTGHRFEVRRQAAPKPELDAVILAPTLELGH